MMTHDELPYQTIFTLKICIVHDLLQIQLKPGKCTPKIVSKSVIFGLSINLGIQIRKIDEVFKPTATSLVWIVQHRENINKITFCLF